MCEAAVTSGHTYMCRAVAAASCRAVAAVWWPRRAFPPVPRLSPACRAPVACMANTFILALLVMAALSVRMLHVSVPSRELDGKLSYVER